MGRLQPMDKQYILGLAERKQWVDSRGRTLPISGMESTHIRNCIRLLERKDPPAKDVLIAVFKRELELRGDDMPPSMELEDRWRMLCNITRDLFTHYRMCKGPAKAERYRQMLDSIGVDLR